MAILPRLTYADLATLPDDGKRYELLEGVLYMSPAPSVRHQAIVMHLGAWLYHAQEEGCGRAFVAPTDVVLAEDTVVQPDLFFVRRERLAILTDAALQGAPDLLIEVLSPATRERDLGAKRQLYARFRVPHFWLVDPVTETVQRYTLTPEGVYTPEPVLRRGDTLAYPLCPAVTVPVATLFS